MLKYYAKKYIKELYDATGIQNFVGLLFEGPGSTFIGFSILNISLLNFFLVTGFGEDSESTLRIIYSLGLFLIYCLVYSETFKFFKSRIGYVKSDMEKLKKQMEGIQELSDPIYNNDKFDSYPKYLRDLVSKINQYKLKKDSFYSEYEEIRRISELQIKLTRRALTVLFIIDAVVIVCYGNSAILTIFAIWLGYILGRAENI